MGAILRQVRQRRRFEGMVLGGGNLGIAFYRFAWMCFEIFRFVYSRPGMEFGSTTQ
ncbi:hypothetical protein NIES2104_41000 [Leptolyngbya sp. NIES-2104]|nr:hypothetical protein NIES2104_41000 [Leptolyngbya sp. NIES-2104]